MATIALNSFKSVIANLTGEEDVVYVTPTGVSTICLSAQITNKGDQTEKVTVLVDSNNDIPEPNFTNIYSTGSFISASAILQLNKSFITAETIAYVTFQNNLLETPLSIDYTSYASSANTNTDAVVYDIANNSTLRTKKAALAYYDKNGDSLITTNFYSSSVNAIDYATKLAKQVVKNQSVTGSVDITRLYQTSVTQSINPTYTTTGTELTGSLFLVEKLYTVIKDNLANPIKVSQAPIEYIKNIDIPKQDSLSPVAAGKLVLEQGYGLIISGSTNLSVILSLLESANE